VETGGALQLGIAHGYSIKEIYGKTSVRVCAPIQMIPLHFRVLMAWDKYRYMYVQCQYSAAVDTGCLRKTRDLYGLQRKTVLLAVLTRRRTMEVRDWNPGMVRTRWCRACNSSYICRPHTTSRLKRYKTSNYSAGPH